jgi:putative radical SAM enzyme (TIGR03279 family)
MAKSPGGVIEDVLPGSIGQEIGLEPGDVLVSINGHPLRDVIDYRYYGAEEELELVVQRDGELHRLEVERDYDEELGLEFTEPVFDGIRVCSNNCPFCFVQQMPKDMRRSLYVRDDDYRYSFLMGNFVTLTGLSSEDWARIAEQHLSPLYVSIHATDPEARRQVLGNPSAPDILPQLRRLGELGIEVHGQIVISPGVNDGEILRRSITDVAALWPTVRTLAVVPVGLTRFHRRQVRLVTPDEARAILDLVEQVMPPLRQQFGCTWFYPSDEMYLLAGRPVPPAAFYDTDAQRENGVGLVRLLLDDWQRARKHLERKRSSRSHRGGRVTLVCGQLIASILADMAAELQAVAGIEAQVVPVVNRFFGESVTVSGLLTGADVLEALQGRDLGQRVFLPRSMFNAEGSLTLDDLTPEELAERLGAPISRVSTLSEIVQAMRAAGGKA